jgi:hypothetical protein
VNTIRRTTRSISLFLVLVLAGTWLAPIALAQDSSDAATRQFIEQRLQTLQTQQQQYAAEFQSVQQSDPARAEYLQRLMQENQVLGQRYGAYLQGQSAQAATSQANAAQGSQTQSGQTAATDPAQAGQEAGGLGGMLKGLMGGGETSTTDIIVQIVAGLGGWYLGKMAFGPIGGIVGGFVAPMLAKWIMGMIKDKTGGGDAAGTPQAATPMNMPGAAQSAHGAPVYAMPEKAAAQSANIAQAKAQMDAAYLALQDAMQRGMTPAEIAGRRNVYDQWRLSYNNALSNQ